MIVVMLVIMTETAVLVNLLFTVGRGEPAEAALVAGSPTVGVPPTTTSPAASSTPAPTTPSTTTRTGR